MPAPWNAEWLNQNSLRAYPFKENMQRHPQTEAGSLLSEIQVPNTLVVDFVITVALDVPATPIRIYLSQLAFVGNLLTLVFSDTDDVQVGTLSVNTDLHTPNQGYTFLGTGTAYEDARGRVVLGDLTRLAEAISPGLYDFAIGQTELEPGTIRPDIRAVRSLQTSYLGAVSDLLFGHIKLLAGQNIRFTYDTVTNTIRVDAISGAGLNEECECQEEAGQCVETVNGIAINDVTIEGDGECVEVRTEGNRIIIEDMCASPCCDCPELEFLTESLKVLDVSMNTLEEFCAKLNERIDLFVTSWIVTRVPTP